MGLTSDRTETRISGRSTSLAFHYRKFWPGGIYEQSENSSFFSLRDTCLSGRDLGNNELIIFHVSAQSSTRMFLESQNLKEKMKPA